jgi:hypothetical protein
MGHYFIHLFDKFGCKNGRLPNHDEVKQLLFEIRHSWWYPNFVVATRLLLGLRKKDSTIFSHLPTFTACREESDNDGS